MGTWWGSVWESLALRGFNFIRKNGEACSIIFLFHQGSGVGIGKSSC
jgi:hypothetical protein